MNYKEILAFIKDKIASLASLAEIHKAPEPLKKAIDSTVDSIYSFILEKAMKKNRDKAFVMNMRGDIINIYDLKRKDLRPDIIASSLSEQKRFWNQTKLTVAEHCVNMTQIVQIIHPDREDLIKWALFHEIYEAFAMDMPTPFKNTLPSYIVAENKTLATLAKEIGLPESMPREIHIIDKMMMTEEARKYMPIKDYWDDYEKKIIDSKFKNEKEYIYSKVKPAIKSVLSKRDTPLSSEEAKLSFSKNWVKLKLPRYETLKPLLQGKEKDYSNITLLDKVREDGLFLKHISSELQTYEICLEAAKENREALKFIHNETDRALISASFPDEDIKNNVNKKITL